MADRNDFEMWRAHLRMIAKSRHDNKDAYANIFEAVEQIEKCGFECQGGALENNTAWRWLMREIGYYHHHHSGHMVGQHIDDCAVCGADIRTSRHMGENVDPVRWAESELERLGATSMTGSTGEGR